MPLLIRVPNGHTLLKLVICSLHTVATFLSSLFLVIYFATCLYLNLFMQANRDVTRMEIFLSLVHLLEQTVKSTGGPAHGNEGENMMLNCSFHQPTSIPATGMPTSLQ